MIPISIDSIPIGAIAYGRSNIPYVVRAVQSDALTLEKPDGSTLYASPAAIVRWELPDGSTLIEATAPAFGSSEATVPLPPLESDCLLCEGDRVRLKKLPHVQFKVISVFQSYQGRDKDTEAPIFEWWAKLDDLTGHPMPAYWKVSMLQLMPIEENQ
jgi:hypothetical protein